MMELDIEQAAGHGGGPGESSGMRYVLRLLVSGSTPNSVQAVAAIKGFCEAHLQGRYELQITDVYQHPTVVEEEQIVALPTLIRKKPLPRRLLIGNLSNRAKLREGLLVWTVEP